MLLEIGDADRLPGVEAVQAGALLALKLKDLEQSRCLRGGCDDMQNLAFVGQQ